MKTIILAGGHGTRIAEYTKKIPKPMIKIRGIPLLTHIMRIFKSQGYKEFIIAAGYKNKIIHDYYSKSKEFKNLKVINTGKKTMTGGRLKRLSKYLRDETFLMTYGDGISDVNIKKLIKFHKNQNKTVTLTAVRPPARFGALKIKNNKVKYFKEKSKMDEGWINGGFFVLNPKIFNFLKNDKTILEGYPLEKLAKANQLMAYRHKGFWYCMDTPRDKDSLEIIWRKKNVPWKKW